MIDTLVIAGGGLKGFSMISSVNELIKNKIIKLKNIKFFYGTSVGSIICFLLSIGYSLDELECFIKQFNFKSLTNDLDIDNLFENFGLSHGSNIMATIQSLLKAKTGLLDISFKNIYKRKNIRLNIIATNITDGIEEVFSLETNPNLSVMTAIRASIAVPIIFSPIKFNGKEYLDGGLVNNFPVNHVSSKNYLGITTNFKNNSTNTLMEYIFNFIHITIKTINFKNITSSNIDRVIILEDMGIDVGETNFDEKNIKDLVKIGEISTKNYLKKNNLVIKKIKFLNFLNENIEFIYQVFFYR